MSRSRDIMMTELRTIMIATAQAGIWRSISIIGVTGGGLLLEMD